MSRLIAFLKTTIGRKMVMAVTGLLLIVFLIGHLGGNLLIFKGAEAFNLYAHSLVSNPLIYLAEAGLLIIFVAHLANAILLTKKNREARPEEYQKKRRAGHTSRKSLASSTMIYSGIVILVFVPFHILTFKFGKHYVSEANPGVRDLHRLVVETFQNPAYVIWYVAAMIVLGFHLWHGFGSAFESMGVRYRVWLKRAGWILAFILAAGFLLIPVILFFMGDQL